jgi:hypothetical protein
MTNIVEKQKLVEIKELVAEAHNSILSLSQMLWEVSLMADDLLMGSEVAEHNASAVEYDKIDKQITNEMNEANDDTEEDDAPVEMSHSDEQRANQMYKEQMEYEQRHRPEPEVAKARGRPRKEAPAEPQQSPQMPVSAPPLPPLPPSPKAPEQTKPNIVERLLGKDADQKAKLRAERMALLEKELAELQKK